ncbi:helix-turn-helix domain-containing protein [Streptomyces sp900105755]|uniref:Helix-turn-helix domain-containing protein n=1 Tax=Streptomyces sp. 900105755 TaxID=3154389 RepID=A0ABV1TX12_9ACTN
MVLSTDSGLSVTELGRRVGLSQSAATHMVEGLQKQGPVRKEGQLEGVAAPPAHRSGHAGSTQPPHLSGGHAATGHAPPRVSNEHDHG